VQLISILSEWGVPVPPVEAELTMEDKEKELSKQSNESLSPEAQKENAALRKENEKLEKENQRIQDENDKLAQEIEARRKKLLHFVNELQDSCDANLAALKAHTKEIPHS